MRADRLVATLLLLQRRGRVTAREVATELEVSERTARRDLDALAVAGVPVYSERGRNGGWRLLGGARTDLSGLSAPEARALFLVAGSASSATPEVKAALRKLVRALPESMRGEAEAAGRSIVLDPGGWGRTSTEAPGADGPEHLSELQGATAAEVQVRLGYRDRSGRSSVRVVHPLGLARKARTWYLVAGTSEGLRTFRVNRVASVERTGEAVVRPAGFDLAASWRETVDRVEELRRPVELECLVHDEHVPVLRWMFDRHAVVGSQEPDGRFRVRLGGQRLDVLAAQVAGFGADVEVVGPPAARAELADIGEQLRSLYGRPATSVVERSKRAPR